MKKTVFSLRLGIVLAIVAGVLFLAFSDAKAATGLTQAQSLAATKTASVYLTAINNGTYGTACLLTHPIFLQRHKITTQAGCIKEYTSHYGASGVGQTYTLGTPVLLNRKYLLVGIPLKYGGPQQECMIWAPIQGVLRFITTFHSACPKPMKIGGAS